MSNSLPAIHIQLASELSAQPKQILSAIELLDSGATVPFIARYRKEATNGLDDTQLRQLETRLDYLRSLEDRKSVILKSISEQNKLTPELEKSINNADSKSLLEDLYLAYKPKRRTKGDIAKEQGLAPLAQKLFTNPNLSPETEANAFISAEVIDIDMALEGAKYILMERFAEDPTLLTQLRKYLSSNALLESRVIKNKQKEGKKYQDYFDKSELFRKIPSHRALAMLRGRNEGILKLALNEQSEPDHDSPCVQIIAQHLNLTFNHKPADKWLQSVVNSTWKNKLLPSMEKEFLAALRDKAEQEAINVFAKNLKDLLMAAPAGDKVTLGIDPGLRTGCKLAVIDPTGKLLSTATIFPHEPQKNWDKSLKTIELLIRTHKIELIAIGNGTASRETDKLVAKVITNLPDFNLKKVIVSEAGASVYSASELAANEFPDLDVSIRGAVSIARRLQDPLAELVKIDPKAIGVGQYQHDVSQSALSNSLNRVTEDCVNAVGVDLNTASAPLLTQVSGLTKTLANNIVAFREKNGRFTSREQLKKIERLGPKAFEQSAGFLKIANGDNPLDACSVHPESYAIVEAIIEQSQHSINRVIGDIDFLSKLRAEEYISNDFGLFTVKDIIEELKKPNRDPRPVFKTAEFKEGIEKVSDLKAGMMLEGIITNVTNFGAFVDIGVHQDGLVHISAMTDKFISDPSLIVKAGDIVKVKVLDVDADRKRIGLTMKLNETVKPNLATSSERPSNKANQKPNKGKQASHNNGRQNKQPNNAAMGNALAEAFAKARK